MIKLRWKLVTEEKKAMCNQFRLPTLSEITHYLQTDLRLPLVKPDFALKSQDIFPKTVAPVLLYQNKKLQLQPKVWGYPSPVNPKKPLFNARIERFYQAKPSMWDHSFARQRCLIIAQHFLESSKSTYRTAAGKKYHERYVFHDPAHPLTLIAGIYDQDHFAMVTTAPNRIMAPIHNRMPLVIAPAELRRWLFQNFTSLVNRDHFVLAVSKAERRK